MLYAIEAVFLRRLAGVGPSAADAGTHGDV